MAPSGKIRVLTDHMVNQMAAGEVIENTSSVIKELVENAIDAGATSIYIEILEGGRELMRVSDNGTGMSHDDALLCLERHATSKISSVEEIESIGTMGFRGEAIPSIASISKFSILTSQDQEGTLVLVEGGKLLSAKPAPRSRGTTIEVKSLFFNVPVRRKFQKSPSYDTQQIFKIVGTLALGHPHIRFELISDQKSLFKAKEETLEKRIASVLGKEYAASLIPLSFRSEHYQIEGFIGAAHVHKTNRTGQSLFINRRAVISPLVASAIKEGYGTLLPADRYPLFVLHLTLSGGLLDVNVHPQKKEVRIRQEALLKSNLMTAVQKSFYVKAETYFEEKNTETTKPFSLEEEPPPFWGSYASLLSPQKTFSSSFLKEEIWEFKTAAPSPLPDFLETTKQTFDLPAIVPSKKTPQVLATLMDYFLLNSFDTLAPFFEEKKRGGLVLIDQKGAYARITYERLLKGLPSKEVQSLLVPLSLHFTPLESSVICLYLKELHQMGFEIKEFGECTFVVDAIPVFLKEHQIELLIRQILSDLMKEETSRRVEKKREEQLALIACRSTLSSNQQLSIEEAQELLHQLVECDNVHTCPLGHPIVVYLDSEAIAGLLKKKGVI